MKKRYLVLGMLALAMKGKVQGQDTVFQKNIISKTDIEVVFSWYGQDGDHSAVTGGIGTEALNVYAPSINFSHILGKNSYTFDFGTDVISSASTDNIDYVVSSASRSDFRAYTNLGYSRKLGKKDTEIGAGTGFSMESDYMAIPVKLTFDYKSPSGNRELHAVLSGSFDDLRWGLLDPEEGKSVGLVYPSELRYREWYDIYRRQSYNLRLGFLQVINKRMVAAIYPEMTYQRGLLATTFHRVYFADSTLRVENLPKERLRFPIGIKVNYFAGKQTILKGHYQYYSDDFGIRSNSIEAEVAVKATPKLTFAPFVRIYHQSASKFFKPYREHFQDETYYTSDNDLSRFSSFKAGLGIRIAPYKYILRRGIFNEVNLRYAYFRRTDKLAAHMISLSFGFSREGHSRKK